MISEIFFVLSEECSLHLYQTFSNQTLRTVDALITHIQASVFVGHGLVGV